MRYLPLILLMLASIASADPVPANKLKQFAVGGSNCSYSITLSPCYFQIDSALGTTASAMFNVGKSKADICFYTDADGDGSAATAVVDIRRILPNGNVEEQSFVPSDAYYSTMSTSSTGCLEVSVGTYYIDITTAALAGEDPVVEVSVR